MNRLLPSLLSRFLQAAVASLQSVPHSAAEMSIFIFLIFKNTFVYIVLRGRESTSGGGAERDTEGDTEAEAGSRL